jgi:hypothetical protein
MNQMTGSDQGSVPSPVQLSDTMNAESSCSPPSDPPQFDDITLAHHDHPASRIQAIDVSGRCLGKGGSHLRALLGVYIADSTSHARAIMHRYRAGKLLRNVVLSRDEHVQNPPPGTSGGLVTSLNCLILMIDLAERRMAVVLLPKR